MGRSVTEELCESHVIGRIERLRCSNIKATIWQNVSEKGPLFPTTFSQPFKDQSGEAYRSVLMTLRPFSLSRVSQEVDLRSVPDHSHERMVSGSFPFGKSREIECGNGYGRRNIEGFYVTAEGDGKSSGGLPADLSRQTATFITDSEDKFP